MSEGKVPEVRFQGFSGEWKGCNLKEASQTLEYGLNAAAIKFDGKNKYIRITDIDDELRTFLQNDLSSPHINLTDADNYKLQDGDILFARTGASVGKSYKYEETDGLVYYAGFLIRARIKSEYSTTFIFQNTLTKKYEKYIQITSQRSGQPGVNAQEYGQFSFFTPSYDEQTQIGEFFTTLDNLLAQNQKKYDMLLNMKKACLDKMFPKDEADTPEVRYKGFSGKWEKCKFEDMYKKVSLKNDLSYGVDKIISVANMYYKSNVYIYNEEYLKTYNIFKIGDIAFEGNKSKNFTHGRFVENTIGNGIVSHVFDVFSPKMPKYDLQFWKYAINNERLMGKILVRSTKSSTMMTNLVASDFLKETFLVPKYDEQTQIGTFFQKLDTLITLQKTKLEKLKNIKKACLDKMFI